MSGKKKKQPATRTAILLMNLGTPDEPTVRAVRRYLKQFFNDKRILPMPWLLRKIVGVGFIATFRAPKSTRLYQRLWTKEGSPLMTNTVNLRQKLQKQLGNDADVFFAMRYQHPSVKTTFEKIKRGKYDRIILLPLFPQHTVSTTDSAIQAVTDELRRWRKNAPELQVIDQFYDHPAFLDAMTRRIASYSPESYDHVLFSYHGLPFSHIKKAHASGQCRCDEGITPEGKYCYRGTCYETTRLLAERLGLKEASYSTSFQSRMSNYWITPFTDKVLVELAQKGMKRILVAAPSFVADCLETIVEIGEDYQTLFQANGGETLTMAESLNDDILWVRAIVELVTPYIPEIKAAAPPAQRSPSIAAETIPPA